jgi:hypothetical protein
LKSLSNKKKTSGIPVELGLIYLFTYSKRFNEATQGTEERMAIKGRLEAHKIINLAEKKIFD